MIQSSGRGLNRACRPKKPSAMKSSSTIAQSRARNASTSRSTSMVQIAEQSGSCGKGLIIVPIRSSVGRGRDSNNHFVPRRSASPPEAKELSYRLSRFLSILSAPLRLTPGSNQQLSLIVARHPHAIHSSASLQAHDFAAPDALVGGKDDAQRIDRGLVMLGQIDLAADRPQEQPLLPLAEVLMAGFIFGRDEFVRLREAAVRVQSRVMDAKCVRVRMPVMVRGTRVRVGALIRYNRHAAVRPDHVLHKISGLAHHRPPPGLVPPDRSVFEHDVKMAVIVYGRRDLAGEPRPDRVHRDRTRACHLTHDVDVVDAAIDDGRSRLHELLMNLPEGASRLLVEIHAHHKRFSERPAYLDEARP